MAPRLRSAEVTVAPGSGGRAATYAGGLQISQEALPEFREDFALFDQDGGGEISSDYHGVVMRAMGENPTHTELEEMIAKGGHQWQRHHRFFRVCRYEEPNYAHYADRKPDPVGVQEV
ncbi:hypothetical protein MTO96_027207 [Rhipicephalus appendiculatus]